MKKYKLNFWLSFVSILPKTLIYFCFIHVMAKTTTGKYSSTVVPDLSGMEAIKRYENDNSILK